MEEIEKREKVNKRPKAFGFFENKEAKNKSKISYTLRKIWKNFVYLLIFFLLVISLVGCIQPFFVRSSDKVGSGFEMYRDKKDISPYVAVVKYNPETFSYQFNQNGTMKDTNFYLASLRNSEKNREINKLLIRQINQNENNEKKWFEAEERVAVQIIDEDGKGEVVYSSLKENERRFLVKTDNQNVYKPTTKFSNIKIFEIKKKENKNINNDKIKSVSKNEVIEIDFLRTYLLEDKKYKDQNILFARDIIEVLTRKTKYALTKFYGKDFSETLKTLEKQENLQNNSKKRITLTKRQFEAINFYNLAIQSYFNHFFFFKTNQNFENKNSKKIFKVEYIQPQGTESVVPLNPYYPAKSYSSVVTSWSEIWGFGPFYALFVWPIFLMVDSIISITSSSWGGWGVLLAIVIVVIVTKLLQFIFTFKSIFSQFKLEELKPKKAKIETKYEPYKDNKLMMLKKQKEILELHKKHNIKPYSMFLPIIITAPVLLSVWRVFISAPEIKSASIIGINFSATSYSALFNGEFIYLIPILFSLIIQIISQLLPRFLQRKKTRYINVYEKEALRKQNRTMNIFSIIFVLIGVFFQAGVQIYWSITGLWMIAQNFFVNRFQRTEFFKKKIKVRL